MKKNDPIQVGARIRNIRTHHLGLSMSDFGKMIDSNVKSGTVSNWETGKNLPNNSRLKKIAELGNTTVDKLLYGKSTIQLAIESVDKLEAFELYLKSLGYSIDIYHNSDGTDGVVVLTKDNLEVEYSYEDFSEFQNKIKDTIAFDVWQKNNPST